MSKEDELIESRTAAKYIPDDPNENVPRLSEAEYAARRQQILGDSHAQSKMAFNACLKVHSPNEVRLYRPMPIRILGEEEAQLMARASSPKRSRAWKRALNTSDRRIKKEHSKKPTSTCFDIDLRGYFRGKYLHRHKGQRPKHGFPYRR
jgi:hypothetical protein